MNALDGIDPLAQLTGRLTDSQDRETYAALISYFQSLPPGDELFRLAQLLGFLTLLGQQLPEALREFLEALRRHSKVAAVYHRKLDKRLAQLPAEIAEGVDPEELAGAMSERFRQQLAATGLDETARLLSASVTGLRKLSGDLSESVRPLTNQYDGIATTIAAELTRLTSASAQLRQHNATLASQAAEERWQWKTAFSLVLLCLGFLLGIAFEKQSTTDRVADLEGQVAQMEQKITTQPQPPRPTALAQPRRGKR